MDGVPGSDADGAWLRNLVIRAQPRQRPSLLLGWMYLGERPSILAVAGGICLVGVYVACHGRVKRRR